jgi:hypothetical protein
MFYKNLAKQKPFNPWHFIWITVVASELLTAFLTFMQYSLFLKTNLPRLLMVGAVAEIQKHNKQLQQEIAARKQVEDA